MSQRPAIPLGIKLLLLFTVLPLVELMLLIWLANVTSFLFTLAVVLLSGFLGAAMAKREGLQVWMKAQRDMQMGRFPADSLIDGLVILIGGALLVTPGIITDIVGFSTLIPGVRAVYRSYLKQSFRGRIKRMSVGGGPGGGGFRVYTSSQGAGPSDRTEASEGEEIPHQSPFADDSPFNRIKK